MSVSLAHPVWLAPLALAVAIALTALALARLRAARRGARLLGAAAPRSPLGGDALRAGALVAVALALAGPEWGERTRRLPASGIDLALLVDVSRSMQASDVPPSRIQRAQRIAAEVLQDLAPGDRAALAAFAGRGVLLTPLTPDRDALTELLPALDPQLMSDTGSSLAAGIASALEAFDAASPRPRVLLVLSDGEAPRGAASSGAAAARAARARVVSVALGSEAGTTLPGAVGALRDARGQTVVTRRDAANLGALAEATDGAAFLADAWGAVDRAALASALRRDALAAPDGFVLRHEPVARAGLLAWIALALILAEALPRRGARRALAGLAPVAALLLAASPGETPDARTLLHVGAGRASAGDWLGAEHAFFAAAVQAQDPALAGEAYYDLGVAALARGDFARARDAFFDAIALAPDDREAQFNLEWTLRRMQAEPSAAGEPPRRPPPEASPPPDGQRREAAASEGQAESRPQASRAGETAEPAGANQAAGTPAPSLSEEEAARWLARVRDDPARALRAALGGGDAPRRPAVAW